MMTFQGEFDATGVSTVRARITAPEGTGTMAARGEGNWLKQADITSMAYTVTDITDPDSETAVVASTSLTVSAVLSDTPSTSPALWKADQIGFNFTHNLPAASFPTIGNRYRVRYAVTTTSGHLRHASVEGPAN